MEVELIGEEGGIVKRRGRKSGSSADWGVDVAMPMQPDDDRIGVARSVTSSLMRRSIKKAYISLAIHF